MKKLFFIITVVLICSACEKNIMDITPNDRLSEEEIWSNAALPQLFINAQYNALQHGMNNDITYFGDEAYNQYDEGGYHIIGLNQISPSNADQLSTYYNYWKTGYTAIQNINIFFAKIDQTPIDAATKAKMIAEVKFLRAFIYAKLIWNYGGVPIIEKVYNLSDNLTGIKRATYSECVAYILKDLNDVVTVLPDQQNGADAGRASADAARALRTRVLLYNASPQNNAANDRSRWQAVADQALELISSKRYNLHTNYHGLFIGDANNEAIFSRYFSTDNSNIIGKLFAPVGSGGNSFGAPSQNLVDAYEMKNGILPIINGAVNPDPENKYDPKLPYADRDPRFYASVMYNGSSYKGRTIQPYSGGADGSSRDASPTGYFNYKYLDETLVISDQFAYTYPWHFFRLAEIYLTYAEAQYNLGNEDEARAYVNKVRERQGVNMPAVTEKGTGLFQRIIHERQIELAMEGHRFYDVRRWKIAPQTEIKPIQGMQVVKNADGTFTYNRIDLLKKVWNERLYLIPLTFKEVQSSGGSLQQNPGYQ
ncbi:RagB/SusD family nutrient uptake outer membrane protein [Pedobacter metabolipauper]|uniref:Putative outer membrane starch-binding protein n=1 Tax=Pedobacter metabolipauper TaxID=425513 RepID=A0A4R6SVH6_9SPHI|nr:RagB/SusD family nutrient uptake outer membrane protein [Pedobacter metabolipauper]TDQ08102.1 putative outer membrane starch-binding protein [Pedobacter metabolipauper]